MSIPNYIKGNDLNYTYRKEVRHNQDGTKTIFFLPVSKLKPLKPIQKREKRKSDFFIKL